MTRARFAWLALPLIAAALLTPSWASAQESATKEKKPRPASVIPAPRNDKWWTDRHESMNKRVAQGNVDLVLIGDSITHGWEGVNDIWQKYYGNRNAVNLGIGGDQTQHVIWRLQNGNLKGISPKLAVVMIGTNNAGSGQKPEEIAAGVRAVIRTLRKQVPQTKILVLAIFPREASPDGNLRKVNAKANELIAKSKVFQDENVQFLDIGQKFLQPDGTLSKDIMPDLLHLSHKGYEIWAEAIEPAVAKVMGPKK